MENSSLQCIETYSLDLNKIDVKQEYLDEWNNRCKDFLVLTLNGEILRNTLYRKGGLNSLNVKTDKYFMLLKYSEDLYSKEFIKKCYPKKNAKEQEKHIKHLKAEWVIIDYKGIEKVVFKDLSHGYLVSPDSVLYMIDSNYYNIETGFKYGYTTNSIQSEDFVFLDNKYEKDEAKKGVMKINKIDGSFEMFK